MLEARDFEVFVEQYGDRAYRFAYGLCGSDQEARELVQEAFVKILDKADKFDSTQNLENWFLTVMKNLFMDGKRRWERKRGVSLDAPIGEGLTVADALADEREESMLARLEREETGLTVRRALAALSADARAILTLIDIDRMPYDEAAKVLDCAPGTVRSRLFRAREALRTRLMELEVAA